MSRTAVVCDDDPMVRKVIESLAKQAGFEVVAEVDFAVRAIEMVGYFKPDVLVLDVSMPGMSGTDAVESIKEASPGTRIVMVSAFDLVADAAEDPKVYDVVDKTDLERLVDVLESMPERPPG